MEIEISDKKIKELATSTLRKEIENKLIKTMVDVFYNIPPIHTKVISSELEKKIESIGKNDTIDDVISNELDMIMGDIVRRIKNHFIVTWGTRGMVQDDE